MTTKHKALELAEILESDSKHTSGRFTYSSRYIADIATMLRTIPELEKKIDEMKAEADKWHQMYVERAVK